jgi:hypothetical protein
MIDETEVRTPSVLSAQPLRIHLSRTHHVSRQRHQQLSHVTSILESYMSLTALDSNAYVDDPHPSRQEKGG